MKPLGTLNPSHGLAPLSVCTRTVVTFERNGWMSGRRNRSYTGWKARSARDCPVHWVSSLRAALRRSVNMAVAASMIDCLRSLVIFTVAISQLLIS